jgi:uncharacterized membrane protein YccC
VRLARWYRAHDPALAALRRAARAAIVMPALFALATQELDNPTLAIFAAFGSFGMLLLVDFGGPIADRVRDLAAFAAVGAVFICVGTLASRSAWLAAAAMGVVGFCVIFAGVVSSVLAGATLALLIAFILPVTLKGLASSIPDRLEGWGLAAGASLLAISLLWPLPARDPLRGALVAACRGLVERLRADAAYVLDDGRSGAEREAAHAQAAEAVGALERRFFATPYRPTGLTTGARAVVRLVDELFWLNAIVIISHQPVVVVDPEVCEAKLAAAKALERCADLLETPAGSPEPLDEALAELRRALETLEAGAAERLPGRWESDAAVVSALDPGFRAQQIGFAVSQIAVNVELAAAAERRSWIDRMLGRQPAGLRGPLAAAHERASAHVEWSSVWLHNSVRGGAGLALAVYVADVSGVQHSFWVVLGTFSVLRSNALSTGQNSVRALVATALGVVAGGLLVLAVGTNTDVLWALLPAAVLVAGVAPAAISFAAGQAAFTLTLVILFNIIQPAGWDVGLVRIEDVAIGCAVSLAVGVLFWPRGAGAALGTAIAGAYTESARYLASAVGFALGCCDAGMPRTSAPEAESSRAAAAARRLDDAFRSYLAERGEKPLPLAEVSGLVSGVASLRLTADSVLDLWNRDGAGEPAEREAARRELLAATADVEEWYERLAAGLGDGGSVPNALEPDDEAQTRLAEAVRRDPGGVAVRLVWTGDHLDAARRLGGRLVDPARDVVRRREVGFRRRWRRAPDPSRTPRTRDGRLRGRIPGRSRPDRR